MKAYETCREIKHKGIRNMQRDKIWRDLEHVEK
jgi:hypothetical protein